MECHKIKPLLDAFAEGELASPQHEMVEEHLRECPMCRSELSAMRRTIRLLAEFGDVLEPPDFLPEVRRRIERRQKASLLGRLIPRPALARVLASVGGIVLAGLGAWLVYRQFFAPAPLPSHVAKPPATSDTETKIAARADTDENRLLLAKAYDPTADLVEAEKGVPALRSLPTREMRSTTEAARQFVQGPPTGEPSRGKRGDGDTLFADFSGRQRGAEVLGERVDAPVALAVRKPEVAAEVWHGVRYFSEGPRDAGEKEGVAAGAVTERPAEEFARAAVEQPEGLLVAKGGIAKIAETRASPASPATPPATEAATAGSQPARTRAAGGGRPDSSQLTAGTTLAQSELSRRASARADTQPQDVGLQVAEGGSKARQEGKVAGDDALESKAGPTGVDDSHEKEEAAGLYKYGERFDRHANGALRPEEEVTREPQVWDFDANGRAEVLLGKLVKSDSYYALTGAVHQLVWVVEDRQKVLAEIRKTVGELGGKIESLPPEEGQVALGFSAAKPDLILVQLKASAYEQFRKNFLARWGGRVVSWMESESRERLEAAPVTGQPQETVILLIRFVEPTEQEQSQQPSPK